MESLSFLVVGKNTDILQTLQRIIENNEGWKAEIMSDEMHCQAYLLEKPVDVLLLSSGLEAAFEKEMKIFARSLEKRVEVIEHYGGGSGLLKSEVYTVFPELSI
ncbi:hypothetical protein ORI89_06780 [Sphingobacterium sp. UT-1RO-CII-1]|uniref:hypothetical protein n=1 Tax=Sphingobacterium sp. UT-1RO-CII-1 TaxID=2995225 RepID=UPI00227C8D98|nr:hypothetical protein [Sphingobacterium sp. UT-1RO-CII-1]MCY4779347.1 hypothetical protein [Sphingobacterium sp. UT-1RO-CII-1]